MSDGPRDRRDGVGTSIDHETWTARQTSTTVTVDGHSLRIAYYEDGAKSESGDGNENERPPVVFVHGIPTWSFLWRDVVDAVSDERRVFALDLAGYGNSAMRDGFDRSIRAQEAVLDAFLENHGIDRVALVAHDIGGGVALRFASHQPERVTELVLSNAVCYDSWPVEFINEMGVPGTVEGWDDEAFESNLDFAFAEGLFDDDAYETHAAFVDGMKAPWRSDEGRTSLSRNAVATNTSHTTELDYGAVTADTLLLWGVADVLQPLRYAERLQDDIAGETTLVELDAAYHWVVEDRPDAYADELRGFLVGER